MPTKLTAHEEPISRIFSNEYVFKIPSYQRPYAWTIEHARELLDDLVDYMKARPGDIDEMPPYFLGSIVLIKNDNSPDSDVVDGQQRLTTLTLILSTIRMTVGEKNAADITQLLYEKGSQILGTQDRFRLSLRERDREFFKKYVQKERGLEELLEIVDLEADSQKNIQNNARLFSVSLQAMPEIERLRLAQFIVTRCYLVVVTTPDLNSAYRIFSVILRIESFQCSTRADLTSQPPTFSKQSLLEPCSIKKEKCTPRNGKTLRRTSVATRSTNSLATYEWFTEKPSRKGRFSRSLRSTLRKTWIRCTSSTECSRQWPRSMRKLVMSLTQVAKVPSG
jgi:Protein of unknown function DUF262